METTKDDILDSMKFLATQKTSTWKHRALHYTYKTASVLVDLAAAYGIYHLILYCFGY